MVAFARRVIDRVVGHVVSAANAVARWAREIWRRLTNEPGYAEAVAALVVAAADLFVFGQLRRLLQQAAMAFVVVVRSLMRDANRDVGDVDDLGVMPDSYWS